MDRTNLLPIGQFAQAGGLPITALRHYDASGVLVPALVDPDSGYRYYRHDQVRTAQLVRALRQLDIPIEGVRELLARIADGRDISADLQAHLTAAERRLEVQRTVVHALLARLSEGYRMNHRITVRQDGPVRALACRATVHQPELDAFARASFQSMYTVAGQAPLTFTGPAFTRLHGLVTEDSASEVEACLPFSATAAQPGELPEGMYLLDIPEALFASTVVDGPAAAFPQIQSAYDAVAAWVAEHGFTFAGPVQEIYRRWCGSPGHPENSLEIAWPIQPARPEPA
ncbi:MerR family transcriptional regulator [Kitasatospora sp. NPDC058170]|uniref:MerR family transcriptional regulator n=1 Tax=Kitasatospora sp. NPDC058170 TaxID=3346364 RepID=UPI0036DB245B